MSEWISVKTALPDFLPDSAHSQIVWATDGKHIGLARRYSDEDGERERGHYNIIGDCEGEKMKATYFHNGSFVLYDDCLVDPITNFGKKKRFKSVTKMVRWFIVNGLLKRRSLDLFVGPGKYTENIQLSENFTLSGIQEKK